MGAGAVGALVNGPFAALVPETVTVCDAVSDDPSAVLAPAEEAAVARAVGSRRVEFTTGRVCAREALRRLGHPTDAVPVGEKRAPRWPDGIVGSITHCAGYRAAAVARQDRIRSLGIDAETHDALPAGVLEAVSDVQERTMLAALTDADAAVHWDRLLFSAKESVYKTWFPLTGRWLGFEDASVTPAPDGTFRAVLRVPGPRVDGVVVDRFTGRWTVRGGLVVTAVVLPACR